MFEIMANLHFLRPWWFLALLPIVWIIWRIWQTNQKQGAWHQVIDPKFRSLLLGENSSPEPTLNEKVGYIGLALAWVFGVIALSGPWVKSVDVPAQKSQQGVVIVLDLSLSMLADDVAPNRLARVKYTLTDLLKQNPDYAMGMVVYAGTAHTITPISEDNQTLLNILPSLSPTVMPKFGSDPIQGLNQAELLLKGAQITQGHIIWVTDDIEMIQLDPVVSWINSKAYSLSLLTVGTETGGVVQIPGYGLLKDDDDKLILPAAPIERFAEINDDSAIKWQHLQVGADNTADLLPPKMTAKQTLELQDEKQKDVNHPLDIGFYFLFILIPLAAFIFRRGTLLNFAAILVIPSLWLQPTPSYAESSLITDLGDVFKSHDQQGYQAWEEQEYEKAGALFEDKQWRASALYRQGKYQEAARLFELDKSATGYFNQGNAWTQDMQLDKAIKAYEQALLIDPNMQIAKENLEIAHKLKNISEAKEMPSEAQQNPTSADSSQAENSEQNAADKTLQQTQQEQSQQDNSSNQTNSENGAGENSPNSQDMNSQQDSNQQNSADQANNQADDDSESTNQGNQSAEQTQSEQGEGTEKGANASQSDKQNGEQNHDQHAGQSEGTKAGLAEDESGADNKQTETTESAAQAERMAQGQSADGSAPANSSNALSEEEQAQINWLNQIPDQPGIFLKRKFEYQFQQNPNANKDNEKQW